MKIFFAPLQGYTEYAYRKAHQEVCGGVDAYSRLMCKTPWSPGCGDNRGVCRETVREIRWARDMALEHLCGMLCAHRDLDGLGGHHIGLTGTCVTGAVSTECHEMRKSNFPSWSRSCISAGVLPEYRPERV